MPTATITSKGQLTLPKSVREQAGTQVGDRLDVSVGDDGTIHLRRLGGSVRELLGMLHRPGQQAVPLESMDQSMLDHMAAEDERIRSGR